jgi:hypothetical protein
MDLAYDYVLVIVVISFAVVTLMNYFTAQERRGRRGGRLL